MNEFHALLGSSCADLWVAVSFSRSVSRRSHVKRLPRTQVGDADASGKVQHLPAIPEGDIRALALGHNIVNLATKALGNMLVAKLDQ